MADSCCAYGLSVRTAHPMPKGLPGGHGVFGAVTFEVRNETGPAVPLPHQQSFPNAHGVMLTLSTDRPFARTVPQQRWRLGVGTLLAFDWSSGRGEIVCTRGAEADTERVSFWFMHAMLPLYLALEEICDVLHGSAVAVGERALSFAAPTGSGKSTLAEYFLKQGHALLSDDKLAVKRAGQEFIAIPSHPYHRPFRQQETLGVLAPAYCKQSLALGAILLPERQDPEAEIRIEPVTGVAGFNAVYSNHLFEFPFLREQRFRFVTALASAVPIWRLQVPWDSARLAEVYARITSRLSAGPW